MAGSLSVNTALYLTVYLTVPSISPCIGQVCKVSNRSHVTTTPSREESVHPAGSLQHTPESCLAYKAMPAAASIGNITCAVLY